MINNKNEDTSLAHVRCKCHEKRWYINDKNLPIEIIYSDPE